MDAALPETIADTDALDDWLSQPSPACITALARFPGDIVVLGVAGKMGPTLARMAVRASKAAGVKRRVIGVARFSDSAVRQRLESWGVETITADLLDGNQLTNLPDAPLVVYLAGRKFDDGTGPHDGGDNVPGQAGQRAALAQAPAEGCDQRVVSERGAFHGVDLEARAGIEPTYGDLQSPA